MYSRRLKNWIMYIYIYLQTRINAQTFVYRTKKKTLMIVETLKEQSFLNTIKTIVNVSLNI